MKIVITGSTGLVGEELVKHFKKKGDAVIRVMRPNSTLKWSDTRINWNVKQNQIDTKTLDATDVVIHLSGANIAGHTWSQSYKETILQSRVDTTKLLSEALSHLEVKPKLFICASAVGIYGTHPFDVELNEQSPLGEDFLAGVCKAWEEATQPAKDAKIRVVHMRLGAVLSAKGGALPKMVRPFRMGLGGRLGSGQQPFCWIALSEIPRIIDFLVTNEKISGAVNFTSPKSVTNLEFTRNLAKVLKRPAVFPVPSFMAKFLFGEMADALLLKGQRVAPKKLLNAGYQFQYENLEEALRTELK